MNRSQVKRDFTPAQIALLLDHLGTDCRGDPSTNDPLVFRTVCHNHDHSGSYKLYYYPDSQRFHCYTECGDNFDVYELVMRARGCSFYNALLYIQSVLGIELTQKIGFRDAVVESNSDELDLLDRYCKIRQRNSSPSADVKILSPQLINLYSKVYPIEWQRDNISCEAMDAFNIRYDVSENEIIIPHYDMDGNLVGIRSRTLNPRKVADGFKYMPTTLNHADPNHPDFRHTLRNYLYGLNKVLPTVKRTGKILLAESEKACLQCYSYYGSDSFAVAVCGSNVSTIQRDIILSLGVKEVFLAFDKEYHEAFSDESDEYSLKILRHASLFTPYMTTYVLWDVEDLLGYKDSPTDRGKEVLEKLMKNKFEVETEKERKK